MFRRWLSGWLVLAILFTQVATAAHACPMMQGAAMAGMPCAQAAMASGPAASLDADQPGVCQQHCQFGHTHQPAAPDQTPHAPAIVPVLLFELAVADAPRADTTAWAQRARVRDRAPPLAHSIAHCCYRI